MLNNNLPSQHNENNSKCSPLRIFYSAILLLSVSFTFSSCFISSKSDVDVFNKLEYTNDVIVKTIKVPMGLTKPFLKTYLRQEEDVPKSITKIIGGIKRLRVTVAHSTNKNLMADFTKTGKAMNGDEWLSLKSGDNFVYLKAVQGKDDIIKNLFLTASYPDENKMLVLKVKCKITMDQLSQLINYAIDDGVGKKMMADVMK